MSYSPLIDRERRTFGTRLTMLSIRPQDRLPVGLMLDQLGMLWPEATAPVLVAPLDAELDDSLLDWEAPANALLEIPSIALRDPQAVLVVLPADHHVTDEAALARAFEAGLAAVERDDVIGTVGMKPTRPDSGFGYLEIDPQDLSTTAEVEAGRDYLEEIASHLRGAGITVETVLVHSQLPAEAISRAAREHKPDLVIMGAHGHSGLKDSLFGATINDVRHRIGTPILVVRDDLKP